MLKDAEQHHMQNSLLDVASIGSERVTNHCMPVIGCCYLLHWSI